MKLTPEEKKAARECEEIVMACLPQPLARLAERGCVPPYDPALLDEDGTAAVGLVDENGEGELAFTRIPSLPLTLTIHDSETIMGEAVEIAKTN